MAAPDAGAFVIEDIEALARRGVARVHQPQKGCIDGGRPEILIA